MRRVVLVEDWQAIQAKKAKEKLKRSGRRLRKKQRDKLEKERQRYLALEEERSQRERATKERSAADGRIAQGARGAPSRRQEERSQRERTTRERPAAGERIAQGARGAPSRRQDRRNQRKNQARGIPAAEERIARGARGAPSLRRPDPTSRTSRRAFEVLARGSDRKPVAGAEETQSEENDAGKQAASRLWEARRIEAKNRQSEQGLHTKQRDLDRKRRELEKNSKQFEAAKKESKMRESLFRKMRDRLLAKNSRSSTGGRLERESVSSDRQ